MERPTKRPRTERASPPPPTRPVEEDEEEGDDAPEEAIDPSQDLYLETVNRSQLDFDQERVCSVTLAGQNIYACLVCGRYFAGRSNTTPAFFHSLDDEHHVFLNLATLRVYILPDAYENTNVALNDIKQAVSPAYTVERVRNLDREMKICHDMSRQAYHPGFVGMNNLKGGDHVGVVVHALAHVAPIRDYFLLHDPSSSSSSSSSSSRKSELIPVFTLLVRKLWSDALLKAHLSPHEFVRKAVAARAKAGGGGGGGGGQGTGADVQDFASFLLNHLHLHLGGSRARPDRASVVSACFQGRVRIESQTVRAVTDARGINNEAARTRFEADAKVELVHRPFLSLTLDLPATPLFQDTVAGDRGVVPQVAILDLLAKYGGRQVQELPGKRRRLVLTRSPPFLMIHFKRFTRSDFSTDKNPTIVNFPIRGLDMAPFLDQDDDDDDTERSGALESTVYDLVANVTHESVLGNAGDERHVYRIQVRDKAGDAWYQIEGLLVEEIKRDMLNVGAPTVMQIWERRT